MDKALLRSYEPVIGLEVHIQLNTQTKAFASDKNQYGANHNENITAVTLAHPGTLPYANKEQVIKAIRLGHALSCKINPINTFDRKHYFYPDLPKGYQITQDRLPICVGGEILFYSGGQLKKVRIHHIHMEEDAGKSIHELDDHYSFVDYNRAGTPLLELVTEPDLRSGREVQDFMSEMQKIVRYLNVSDGNMEEGSMRCDCNVSVRRKGDTKLGERCEIKNVNSKRFARQAVEYEFKRQVQKITSGEPIQKTTLNFNPGSGKTTPIRDKEEVHDYRYFADPDLPPVHLNEEELLSFTKTNTQLPVYYSQMLINECKLSIDDAQMIVLEKAWIDSFIAYYNSTGSAKLLANIFVNKFIPYLRENPELDALTILSLERMKDFIDLVQSGKVSTSAALQILFPTILQSEDPVNQIAKSKNLLKSEDQSFLDALIDETIRNNPSQYIKYKKGNKGMIGFFMGQIMKKSKGKADPKILKRQLMKKLDENSLES